MLPRVRTLSGCSTYSSTSSPSSTMAMRERSLLALMTISFFMRDGKARRRGAGARAGGAAGRGGAGGCGGGRLGRDGGRGHGRARPRRPTGREGGRPAGERAEDVRNGGHHGDAGPAG